MHSTRRLFIIGPAAAGKTTFSAPLSITSGYEIASDLEALKQVFEFHRDPSDPLVDCSYWPELADQPYGRSKFHGATSPLPDGGHDIHDLDLWHEALRRVVLRRIHKKSVMIEFARGTDSRTSTNAYEDALIQLFRDLPELKDAICGIIHVHAPFEIRIQRNELRRLNGGHFVSRQVMESVYRSDPFLEIIDKNGKEGEVDCGIPVPYISISNVENSSIATNLANITQWMQNHSLLRHSNE